MRRLHAPELATAGTHTFRNFGYAEKDKGVPSFRQCPAQGKEQVKMARKRKAKYAEARHQVKLPPKPLQLRTIRDFLVDLSLTPSVIAARRSPAPSFASRLGYIGWVGHANLGDEAMFQAIATSLAPNLLLPLLPAPGERLLQHLGTSGSQQFGAVVLGGGTLINPLYLAVARLVASWNTPLYVAGTGVGSPGFGFSSRNEGDLRGWTDLLCRSPLVAVRGPHSEERLKRAGVSNVEVIGDPALAFTPVLLPPPRSTRRLVLNLGPERHFRNAGIAALARDFLRDGGEVVGIALGAGDRAALLRFRKENRLPGIAVESHRTSAPRLLQTLADCEFLISVRLHAAVLGACAGVPSILLAYRSKCLDFMASMNLQEFAVPPSTANEPVLRELLDRMRRKPDLRGSIHRTALAWAETQRAFFQRLNHQISSGNTNP